jgi:hypothetical protein
MVGKIVVNPPGNHRDRRPDTARHAIERPDCDPTNAGPKNLLANQERQDTVVVSENSPGLDLLELDRPLAYTSKMAEETYRVTNKVAPSRRSTK